MNIENTIKKDLEFMGIKQVEYAKYLEISQAAVSKRLQRKATREERDGFEAFLRFKGINLIREVDK